MDFPLLRTVLRLPTLKELDESLLCWCEELDDGVTPGSICGKCSGLVVIFSLQTCVPGQCICAHGVPDLAYFCTNCRAPIVLSDGTVHPKNRVAVKRAVKMLYQFKSYMTAEEAATENFRGDK
jgi:hypothetical protein